MKISFKKLFFPRTGRRESLGHLPAARGAFASGAAGHCPFVSEPFVDCYVANINSQNIDLAINYCGGNFEECEIYRKRPGKPSDPLK